MLRSPGSWGMIRRWPPCGGWWGLAGAVGGVIAFFAMPRHRAAGRFDGGAVFRRDLLRGVSRRRRTEKVPGAAAGAAGRFFPRGAGEGVRPRPAPTGAGHRRTVSQNALSGGGRVGGERGGEPPRGRLSRASASPPANVRLRHVYRRGAPHEGYETCSEEVFRGLILRCETREGAPAPRLAEWAQTARAAD